MDSLLDVARVRAATKRPGPICTVAVLRNHHSDKSTEIEELVMASGPYGEVTYAVAAEILSEQLGSKIKWEVVSRHKRRECACPS